MKKLGVLPSLFTLGNLLCGFGALAVVAHAEGNSWDRELVVASWLILFAMIFDLLDGKVARWTRFTSDFGGELDSLCDMVTFGAAPGLIVYLLSYRIFHFAGPIAVLLGGCYIMATALRLARFNVANSHDEESHQFFQGLPSPAAAGAVASLVILDQHLIEGHRLMGFAKHDASLALEILPYVALASAALMVSNVPYVHVTNLLLKRRRRPPELILLGVVFTFFLIRQPEVTFFCVFGGYLCCPLASVFLMKKEELAEEVLEAEEDEDEDEEALI